MDRKAKVNKRKDGTSLSVYDTLLREVSTRSHTVAVLQWPAKRLLDRLKLLDGVRRLMGRPERSLIPNSRRSAADLLIVRVEGAELRTTSARLAPSALAMERPAIAPTDLPRLLLAGGWGYGNLGDEAILAGYLFEARARDVTCDVVSVSPPVTRASLSGISPGLVGPIRVLDESTLRPGAASPSELLLLGGGGYLNGTWSAEIGGKLTRLAFLARGRRVTAHAVELRTLGNPSFTHRIGQVFTDARLSVRDSCSAQHAATLGLPSPDVVPDAISLLYPHIGSLRSPFGFVRDKVLVNLLDVPGRSDASEAEFPTDQWVLRCKRLLASLERPAIGLALDQSDIEFIVGQLGLVAVLPLTVRGLISVLGSARAVISMRMHPALLSTMLGVPTWALPYCGKVRPTLTNLGLDSALVGEGELAIDMSAPGRRVDYSREWTANYSASSRWLEASISGVT